MIFPISTKIEENKQDYVFEAYGYRVNLTTFIYPVGNPVDFSVQVKCKYDEIMPYPMIRYNRALKQFEGVFNSFFSVKEDNAEEWIKSIKNASAFVKEMNETLSYYVMNYENIRDNYRK